MSAVMATCFIRPDYLAGILQQSTNASIQKSRSATLPCSTSRPGPGFQASSELNEHSQRLAPRAKRQLSASSFCGQLMPGDGQGLYHRYTCVSTQAFASGDPSSAAHDVLEPITSEEQLERVLREAEEAGQGVVIDWMAQWCRKCIYLKPKLEKLALEYTKTHRWYVVDVNAVPSTVVKKGHVTKMPTIQLWTNGKWQAEVIGGHKAWMVLDEIREMLSNPVNTASNK